MEKEEVNRKPRERYPKDFKIKVLKDMYENNLFHLFTFLLSRPCPGTCSLDLYPGVQHVILEITYLLDFDAKLRELLIPTK